MIINASNSAFIFKLQQSTFEKWNGWDQLIFFFFLQKELFWR